MAWILEVGDVVTVGEDLRFRVEAVEGHAGAIAYRLKEEPDTVCAVIYPRRIRLGIEEERKGRNLTFRGTLRYRSP